MSVCVLNIKNHFRECSCAEYKNYFRECLCTEYKNYFHECLCNEYKIIIFGSVCAVSEISYTAYFKKYIISNCVFSDQFFLFECICVCFDRSVSSDV